MPWKDAPATPANGRRRPPPLRPHRVHPFPVQALVTCTRNSAVDSVVDKVARLEGGILVFGNVQRLGERAAQHTLEARVEGHPAVVRDATPCRFRVGAEPRLRAGASQCAVP